MPTFKQNTVCGLVTQSAVNTAVKDVVVHNFSIRKTCKNNGSYKSTLCRYVIQTRDGSTFNVAKKSCTTNQVCRCFCPCFAL